MKTFVYVDGFNLYFGSIKGTPHKWLNIRQLCETLLPRNQIECIKYFTAKVGARPSNPSAPVNQEAYLRALRTLPKFEIYFGHFLTHTVRMPLAHPVAGLPAYVEVIKTEEKGSERSIWRRIF